MRTGKKKIPNSTKKLVDLVCTNNKCDQISKKCAFALLAYYLELFGSRSIPSAAEWSIVCGQITWFTSQRSFKFADLTSFQTVPSNRSSVFPGMPSMMAVSDLPFAMSVETTSRSTSWSNPDVELVLTNELNSISGEIRLYWRRWS